MSRNQSPRDEQILELLKQPHRNKAELIKELENAKKEGRREFAFSVAEILDERFPGWEQTTSPGQHSRATSAMFDGEIRKFDTAVAAYIWLMRKMIEHLPQPLDLLYEDYVFSKTVVRGERGAIYLARSPQDLFPDDPGRASDHSDFWQLRNGWYLSINLSNQQKHERLHALAAYSNLKLNKDWSWTADVSPIPDLDELLADLFKTE